MAARARSGMLIGLPTLLFLAAATVHAGEGHKPADWPTRWAQAGTAPARAQASPAEAPPPAETFPRMSYTVPLYGIVGFNLLLSAFDRVFLGSDYDTDLSTIRRNLRGGWEEDRSTFAINQLGHPYQGALYYNFARSAGLAYWESLPYAVAGSAMWEIAGETTPPSRNDMITTSIGGSFLGEALYRMASLVLEQGKLPKDGREAAAAAISPAMGLNRHLFGRQLPGVFSSGGAPWYSRLQVGASSTTQSNPGSSTRAERNEGLADFSLEYGMPGRRSYRYARPFDYFQFQLIGSTANAVESIATRGLLLGDELGAGRRLHGVWGLYGSYDYLAPQFFRVSSTALSLGTTVQARLLRSVTLQGTALGGAGYASVGTVGARDERDNHFGLAPQALLALRLLLGDTAALDLSAREYFVSDIGAARAGRDNITRADASLTVRVHRRHAVSLRYLRTRRDATFPDLGSRTQTREMIGLFYTLLGDERFGAVLP